MKVNSVEKNKTFRRDKGRRFIDRQLIVKYRVIQEKKLIGDRIGHCEKRSSYQQVS